MRTTIKDIIYNPPAPIKLQKWEMDRLLEMGVDMFSLLRKPFSATELAQMAFKAGEYSGREKFKKELKSMIGV
jgi:hypothetical protein